MKGLWFISRLFKGIYESLCPHSFITFRTIAPKTLRIRNSTTLFGIGINFPSIAIDSLPSGVLNRTNFNIFSTCPPHSHEFPKLPTCRSRFPFNPFLFLIFVFIENRSFFHIILLTTVSPLSTSLSPSITPVGPLPFSFLFGTEQACSKWQPSKEKPRCSKTRQKSSYPARKGKPSGRKESWDQDYRSWSINLIYRL